MNRTPLHSLHAQRGAAFGAWSGWELAQDFGDPKAEYMAATQGVALLDRSANSRFRVSGKDALDLLNRLTSNKVNPLPPGSGAGTLLTTNKGRVIDLLHLFATEQGLLMLASPGAQQRVAEWIDAYTFLEEVSLEDATEGTAQIGLLGPGAEGLLRRITGEAPPHLERYGSAGVALAGGQALLLRSDPLNTPGYDLVAPGSQAVALWGALAQAGATPMGETTYDLLRIEAGIPRHGWEVSEEVNPWEVALEEYIHFAKGCYIGQEVVLRLKTYDKVQRRLVRLAFSGPGAQVGAKLRKGEAEAGRLTSVAVHPLTGEQLGLGLVRAALASVGTELNVAGAGEGTAVQAVVKEALAVTTVGV
jgi:hypothetical protein